MQFLETAEASENVAMHPLCEINNIKLLLYDNIMDKYFRRSNFGHLRT